MERHTPDIFSPAIRVGLRLFEEDTYDHVSSQKPQTEPLYIWRPALYLLDNLVSLYDSKITGFFRCVCVWGGGGF